MLTEEQIRAMSKHELWNLKCLIDREYYQREDEDDVLPEDRDPEV